MSNYFNENQLKVYSAIRLIHTGVLAMEDALCGIEKLSKKKLQHVIRKIENDLVENFDLEEFYSDASNINGYAQRLYSEIEEKLL